MPVVLVAFVVVGAALLGGLVAWRSPDLVHRWAHGLRGRVERATTTLHERTRSARTAWAVWYGGWVLGLIAVTTAVGKLLLWLGRGDSTGLDRVILDYFHRGRTPLLSTIWDTITFTGDSSLLIPLALVSGLVWHRRRGDAFLLSLLGGAYLGASVLFNTAKRTVGRLRPAAEIAFNRETGMAFPSGHTTDASAFYVALGLLLVTLAGTWAVRVALGTATGAVVLLVATSRLYLGAHWFTDVVAGAVLGTVWAGVLWLTLTSPRGPYPGYARAPAVGAGARGVAGGLAVRGDRS